MKLRIERDALVEAVTWAARALPAKPAIPVLSGIMIDATAGDLADGEVRMSAFDYETSARITTGADVTEPGQALVSGRLLADICKSLPAKPVDLALDGTQVKVTCGSAKFKLLTMPTGEYPSMPTAPDQSGTVPSDVFAHSVAQVAVAASRDISNPVLTALRIIVEGDRLTFMATDRYRLAARTFSWTPDDPNAEAALNVRAFVLSEAAKTLPTAGLVSLGFSDGMIGIGSESRTVTSLLTDGQYPDALRLFPTAFNHTAVVDVASLVESVKRVALVAEKNTPVRLSFTDGAVDLTAGRGEDASGEDGMDAYLDGGPIDAAFNPGFLVDGLNALTCPYARFSFTEAGKPVVLTGQVMADGPDETSYRYLIMPIRTGAPA